MSWATHGGHEPERPGPRPAAAEPELPGTLRLQRRLGNRATAALLARYTTQPPPAPPSAGSWSQQFLDAQAANWPLEGAPMRTLQVLLALRPTGKFDHGTFDALNALTPPPATPGVVDAAVLESLLAAVKSKGMHVQFARLVLTLERGLIDLSVDYDPKLGTAFQSVAEGGLAKVTLGPSAFASVAALKTAILAAVPMIMGGVVDATSRRLGPDELAEATAFNPRKVHDFRAEDIIGRAVRGSDSNSANSADSEDFAQWVADFQARNRLTVNGKVDDPTFAKVVERLEKLDRHSSILRLVLDRFQLDHDWIANVSYDHDVTRPFEIERGTRGPVNIRFGPHAFVFGLAGLIHTVADATRQARVYGQDQLGGVQHSVREQEMLGKSEQLTSDLPEESRASFKLDVNDFLAIWRALTVEERRRNVDTLKKVKQAVEARYAALGSHFSKHVKELRKEIARVAEEAKWHISRD